MNKLKGCIFFVMTSFIIISCNDNIEITTENYSSVVQNLGFYEALNPTLFLEAGGQYGENFWGDKLNIQVEISNKAKIASYKDVKLKVIYYSKTNSVIGSNDYIIYEVINPQKIITVALKIDNYQNVNAIGWEIIDAEMNSWN